MMSITRLKKQSSASNARPSSPKNSSPEFDIAELLRNGTIELSGRNLQEINLAKESLPYGMSVYVPSIPSYSLTSNIKYLRALKDAGFNPIPHIAARRIVSKQELLDFLKVVTTECGVYRVLLIGGDLSEPIGPYSDSAAILQEGILADAGIRDVGFAGHPEGHPVIPDTQLWVAVQNKITVAGDSGLNPYMVTQFSFAPMKIIDYCARLRSNLPDLPVYVGMAGPTSPARLIRYASVCGVSNSLRALRTQGFSVAGLASHPEPRDQLIALARYCESHTPCNVIGAHIYSFGGFASTANWLRDYLQAGKK